MYISRLAFHTQPGKTGETREELTKLAGMIAGIGGKASRILHTHFASLGAPDLVFEQEVENLATLEKQIEKLTESPDFQMWTKKMPTLLRESPKREIYLVIDSK